MPYADPAKRKAYAKNYYSQPEAKAKAAAHRAANRKENAARQRDYYNNNKDKCLATARNSERKRLYGITTEEMVDRHGPTGVIWINLEAAEPNSGTAIMADDSTWVLRS